MICTSIILILTMSTMGAIMSIMTMFTIIMKLTARVMGTGTKGTDTNMEK
ncbi:MAG: hypothetical protein NVS4B7_01960 [Ktedonobacteraceae bacterium]